MNELTANQHNEIFQQHYRDRQSDSNIHISIPQRTPFYRRKKKHC